ncbi:hypothetical protein EU805_10110 [Salipiger sp. IMCC34102]|uniref:hypothetical protein n=1 Tax=Salipiger sp. IMCC34102 TaxID=2510647 RepID=UPI00101CF385|nr:hypothetical protein [Salipiger sp. IMCC34102]RYH02203.1 hypothetical protein EU805_10110 [Salipiger sp. IMCC34102]
MRSILALLPLAVMAACVSPQQQCLSDAARELRINEALIAKTQANLDRGFAVDVRQRVSTRPGICRDDRVGGVRPIGVCNQVRVRDVAVPEPINTRIERETLDQLVARRAELQRATRARIDQCRVLYPE